MKIHVKKSALNNFQTFFHQVQEFVSSKHRNHQAYQRETMRIMDRIAVIRNRHPELSKYLNEMPEFPSNENDSEIRLVDLRNYNNHLLELLEKYEQESHKDSWFI